MTEIKDAIGRAIDYITVMPMYGGEARNFTSPEEAVQYIRTSPLEEYELNKLSFAHIEVRIVYKCGDKHKMEYKDKERLVEWICWLFGIEG